MDRPPGKQRKQSRTDAPEIRSTVNLSNSPQCLLGCHECGCSHRASRTRDGRRFVGLEEAPNAEIENAHRAIAHDEEIFGLDIAMDDLRRVGRAEHVEKVMANDGHLLGRELVAAPSSGSSAHRLTKEKRHDQEDAAVLRHVVVGHRDDPWMPNRIRKKRLASEESFDLGIRGKALVEDLDRDLVTVSMHARVDGGHSADPDQPVNAIATTNVGADALQRARTD
ncbi:hypothetical protein LZC94_28900 [Pendulispora albinea]|uniref:Uncharacterized protein n=1 Tax=Pendulispora albinea TaxID=2741071 RepID=A0ABZ2LPN2_9BACT